MLTGKIMNQTISGVFDICLFESFLTFYSDRNGVTTSGEYGDTEVDIDTSYSRVGNVYVDFPQSAENTEQSNTHYEDIRTDEMLPDHPDVPNTNSEGNDDGYMEPVTRNPMYQALGHREAERKAPYTVLDQNSDQTLSQA